MQVILNEAYFELVKQIKDEEDLNFQFDINKIKCLPSERYVDDRIDNEGRGWNYQPEGDWYVVYDEDNQDGDKYGYYRFSTSLGQFPNEALAYIFYNSLIKSITTE